MSLQPGPQDPTDESALTPPAVPDATQDTPTWEAPEPPAPSAPASAADATWAAPPPPPPTAPTGYPAGPMGGAPGYGPPPPVDGWASPPPPAPGQPYAPPPPQAPGSYAGPPQGYPPSGYPPVGYQAVGYPTAARQTESKAVVALILAISSWLICPFITAIAALVLAGQSNRAIVASGGRLEGRSMNTATKVIAWINIVLSVLALIGVLIALVFFATTDSTIITDITEESTQF